jgi:carbonic anhydrase/acetyltransferase-like protein (isoleucine patch superfamily)
MRQLEKLIDRIIAQLNINLRKFDFDAAPYLKKRLPKKQLLKFYAFYGITAHHPIHFHFSHSSLAGSYFLGQCKVDNSVLYKSDIRGDELKSRGAHYALQDSSLILEKDEVIEITGSYLIKTLVHSYSHDPETPDVFFIKNTATTSYANIHGSPMEGCFLGPFSTVDLTRMHDCKVGIFSYVQTGELVHTNVPDGQIWIKSPGNFEFTFQHSPEVTSQYVVFKPGVPAGGTFIDFVEEREGKFQRLFDVIHRDLPFSVPTGASINRYAVIQGNTIIHENVLVAQRAYLDNAWLGKGANAQENCYVVDARLDGDDVLAHGAKVIHARLGKRVFVGFNSFLRGNDACPLLIKGGSIVMPHTVIDLEEPLEIPEKHLVWGLIRNRKDLKANSLSLEKLSTVTGQLRRGNMQFKGDGAKFIAAFKARIDHILSDNGAYFDGKNKRGHAQTSQAISFNLMQPYAMGPSKGLFPTIDINP